MRLSTLADRDDERSVAVIRAALDAGATLLDTSDAYCLDDADVGHNERLIARALDGWTGDRTQIVVATKGGMRRPKGAWLPDGRAKHLTEACEASRRALGVDVIDLYQLHVVDPRTAIETSVRALARLQADGKIRDLGLCNVAVHQIKAAQSIVKISSVQVSLSPFDDESLRNGVAEYCHDNDIRLIAHRPLGGERVKQLARNPVLSQMAARHASSNEEIVLSWLMSFGGAVVPIPGATRVGTATSISRALAIELDAEERGALDAEFSGRLLRVPRVQRRPRDNAQGDVVIVMGMPGAGKSELARGLESEGYARLNRDALGGSLADLAPRMDDLITAGHRQVVLDNTYPTRKSRNVVIETAWARGVRARCVWLTTDVAEAQINSIHRMLRLHGSLPTPEIIRERGKADPRYLLPDAQFRYERTLEPPTLDEGFESIDARTFVRRASDGDERALIFDFDDLMSSGSPVLDVERVALDQSRLEVLGTYRRDAWRVFVHAWRPQVARGETTADAVEACLARLREIIRGDVDVAFCPHDAGPPVCWCRKPIPGSVIELAMRRGVSLASSIVVGVSAADRTMAERVGAQFETSERFFAKSE